MSTIYQRVRYECQVEKSTGKVDYFPPKPVEDIVCSDSLSLSVAQCKSIGDFLVSSLNFTPYNGKLPDGLAMVKHQSAYDAAYVLSLSFFDVYILYVVNPKIVLV